MNTDDRSQRVVRYLDSILRRDGSEEVLESAHRASLADGAESLGASNEEVQYLESADQKVVTGEPLTPEESFALEAIIFPDKRPVIDVIHDRYQPPTRAEWSELSNPEVRGRLEQAMRSIGRVELVESTTVPYLGTGFMVAPNVMLTNRHVADDFVAGLGRHVHFITGLESQIDYERWIVPSDGMVLKIVRPLLIHPWWDAALVEVEGFPSDREPVKLLAEPPGSLEDRLVTAVGYPAFDSRNDAAVQNRVFRSVYNVKRMQPGRVLRAAVPVRSFGKDVDALSHDCSTLGGNSGSAVLDVETGHVLALHFGGVYLDANYAVPAWELVADPRVREIGVGIEGTPTDSTTWVTIWNELESESFETAGAEPASTTAVVVTGDGAGGGVATPSNWFEHSSDNEIAQAYAKDPGGTRARLADVLGPDEAADYVADLESEVGASESTAEGWFSRAPNPDLPEIIFLHGIMGGHLAHAGFFRNRIWLDPLELVAGSLAERLTLGENGLDDAGDLRIEPDGHVQLKYRKAARKWRKAGFVVHPFSFDWRRGVHDAADQLHLLVEQRWVTRRRPVVLVGHSMGGLVISAYADRHSTWRDRVERVVLIGSPLGGSYAVPMTVLGFNRTVKRLAQLTRNESTDDFQRMAASLPGLIDMLPNPGIFDDADDFYGQPGWPGPIRPAQRWLTQSKNLKSRLRTSPVLERSTMLVTVDKGTVGTMPWNGDQRSPGPRTAVGDGTVPAASAVVEGVPAFKVDREHGDMPNDPKAIQGVIELVQDGRTSLDPVVPEDLDRVLPLEVETEAIDEDDLAERRARFEEGRMTLDDLTWLGEL